jgi:hypothetical protein
MEKVEKCLCGGTLKRVVAQVTHPGSGKILRGTKVICTRCN